MRIIFIVSIVLLSLSLGINGNAQNFESYKRQQLEAIQAYKHQSQEEWDSYRRKTNEEFAEFIKKPWELRNSETPKPEPSKVPDIPPVVLPDLDIDLPEEDNPIDVEINLPKLEDEPIPIAPIPYKPKPAEKKLTFTYYGTSGSIRFDTTKKVSLNGTDERAVSYFWKGLSGEAYDNVIADCQSIRGDRDLCDWAYYRMTEKVAETLYNSRNERAVFHAWLLTQSGFSVRLGRENGNIHLLLGTTSILFGKLFWKLEGGYYTLMDVDDLSSIYIMDVQFPQTTPLRTRMNANNALAKSAAAGRQLNAKRYPAVNANVSCDKNMLAFLQDIPISAIEGTDNADYMMYATMPLSDKAGQDLYSVLFNQVAGKSEEETANILLNFVQTAFEYKTDGEVWGCERPFFPEETLYYPYSDCEDRAILFCNLVKNILALDVAFVSYPGHLATAVHFTQDISGDYFLVNGKRYLVCDPTYINAPIGWTMPGMNNSTAQVFLME